MRKSITLALSAAATLYVGSADAGTEAWADRFYFQLEGGWSHAGDADIREKDPFFGFISNPNFGKGHLDDIGSSYVVGGGVGYQYTDMLRGEVVVTYRGGFELDDRDQAPLFPFHHNADIDSLAVMYNGYVDIPFAVGLFRPYVGAGVGWARNSFDDILVRDILRPGNGPFLIPGGSDSGLAWQAMAGISASPYPWLVLALGYRFFDSSDLETDAGEAIDLVDGPTGDIFPGIEGDLTAHEVIATIRIPFSTVVCGGCGS
jgi:opacity protein-like surface antigen